MDIGKRKEDYKFYEGYEGEKDVVITLPDISYHIWDGYFDDIFGNPVQKSEGWTGFTRDYNEFINAFDDECIECAILPEEYLMDANLYLGRSFMYKESAEVLAQIISVLSKAEKAQICVLVRVN